MKRAIITPAGLAPAALGELKDWLGIAPATGAEDATLVALLRAALEACEAFTGALPLQAGCEELLAPAPGWQGLATRPVQAITAVQRVPVDGARSDLPPAAYALDLAVDGGGRVRLLDPAPTGRIAVRFTAGLAADWASLPDGLRHGVVRLAAHLYRQRDPALAQAGEGAGATPPAAVAALWRPWRGVRLL